MMDGAMANAKDKARRAQPIDWVSIKELYCEGVAPSDLADRFGCSISSVLKKGQAQGWAAERELRVQERAAAAFLKPSVVPQEVAKHVRDWFMSDLKRVTDALDRQAPNTLDINELAKRQGIVQDCWKLADSMFGWSKEPEKPRVRTELLVEMVRKLEEQAGQSQVIEAQRIENAEPETAQSNGHCANIVLEGETVDPEEPVKEACFLESTDSKTTPGDPL